jgi:hypothetical protein
MKVWLMCMAYEVRSKTEKTLLHSCTVIASPFCPYRSRLAASLSFPSRFIFIQHISLRLSESITSRCVVVDSLCRVFTIPSRYGLFYCERWLKPESARRYRINNHDAFLHAGATTASACTPCSPGTFSGQGVESSRPSYLCLLQCAAYHWQGAAEFL